MNPEPSGSVGSSRSAACERGVGSSPEDDQSGLVAWGGIV